MNPRDKLEAFSVTAAARVIKSDPTVRAAVMWGPSKPLMDSARTRVRLFERVGDADEHLRAIIEKHEEAGWVKVWGALKYGAFEFERDGAKQYVHLSKR